MPQIRSKGCIPISKNYIEERIEGAGDTFLISFLDGYLYYSPLANVSLILNEFGASAVRKYFHKEFLSPQEQSLIDYLSRQDVFKITDIQQHTLANSGTKWAPTNAIFSNTQKCTLRCKYCYAEGGRLEDLDIPWNVAKAAIELVVNNAKVQQVNPSISFLGEGEATASWSVFQNIIEYFKEQCRLNYFRPTITLSTNGVFPQSRINYIAANCTHLTFSLDGVREVHNENRVFPNGSGSFDRIIATMKELDVRGKAYNIRSTVTATGSLRLIDFVQFVGNNLHCKSIHFEPVFDASVVTNLKGQIKCIGAQNFIENFREARRAAAEFGIEIYYSGAALKHRQTFCGAGNANNFLVTSRGIVTSCNEVLKPSDIRAGVFHYGKWNQEVGEFVVDQEAIDRLERLNVHEIPKCQGCIAKYNCAGDCYAKSALTDIDQTSAGYTTRCHITRELLKDNLIYRLMLGKLGIVDALSTNPTYCPL